MKDAETRLRETISTFVPQHDGHDRLSVVSWAADGLQGHEVLVGEPFPVVVSHVELKVECVALRAANLAVEHPKDAHSRPLSSWATTPSGKGMGLSAMVDLQSGVNHIQPFKGKHLLW